MTSAKDNENQNLTVLQKIEASQLKTNLPDFGPGDRVKVHAKIVEGSKERIQIFEGDVIRRSKKNTASATFTVRKISHNTGVERTFMLHSPRIEKIEVMTRGKVRRARLYYLRPLRGKKARIKSRFEGAKRENGNGAEASKEATEA